MKKLSFKGNPLKTDLGEFANPKNGVPFIYILTDSGSKMPFYVGEYGKSSTYNVVTRIRRHFSKSGTLARVSTNMPRFGHTVPSEFDAYIKELPDEFKDASKRAELEAWVIYKICHVQKIQDHKFCVTKYVSPTNNYFSLAGDIINEFQVCS